MILITGKKYDVLKELAMVWLPALGTLYFALAGIWDLPAAEKVVGTIVAIDTFVGIILHLSSRAYATSDDRFDGEINVSETEQKKSIDLVLKDLDPNEVEKQDQLLFKVNKPTESV